MANNMKILKDHAMVEETLKEINTIIRWFKEERGGKFRRLENKRIIKKEKMDRLTILFDRIGIKTTYIGQVIYDKWSLERAITKSKSTYLKFIDIVGGPKRSTVKQKPYKFSGVLPGSFESNKR